ALQVGLLRVRRDNELPCALLHLDEHTEIRPLRRPWLEAKRRQQAVDLRLVEIDNEIVGPVTGPLLVARRRAGHLVVIVIGFDEVFCPRLVGFEPDIAGELQRARDLDQHVLETGGKADDSIRLTLSGDDRLCAVEAVGRGSEAAATTGEHDRDHYPGNGARGAETIRFSCHLPGPSDRATMIIRCGCSMWATNSRNLINFPNKF